ncbi:MAG: hypothetical protein ACOX4M_00640 [Acetivibrionales bacterium]|jgi:hypothetical protein
MFTKKRNVKAGNDTRGFRGIKGSAGSAAADVVIVAAVLLFVILPVFSAIIEKYTLNAKAQTIRDAVDITNISAYNALNAGDLGKVRINASREKCMKIFKDMLARNLELDHNLDPKPGSVAEGRVEIKSLEIYSDGFPAECPHGTAILRPSVHSSIMVPIRPSLYSSVILRLLGKEHIDIAVHVDSEIPVNN